MAAPGRGPLHCYLFYMLWVSGKTKVFNGRELLPAKPHTECCHQELNTVECESFRSRVLESQSKRCSFSDPRWRGINTEISTGIAVEKCYAAELDGFHV